VLAERDALAAPARTDPADKTSTLRGLLSLPVECAPAVH
jgi:hypothetical protein